MHEHNECDHELEYCKICDTVYCEKCRKEWIKKTMWVTYGGTDLTVSQTTPNIVYCNHG